MVTKIGEDTEYPTKTVPRRNGCLIWTEEVIDYSRVSVDPETGEKVFEDS